jgi:hypothetical protein
MKYLKAAEPMLFMETGKDTHPQMNKTWSVLKQ